MPARAGRSSRPCSSCSWQASPRWASAAPEQKRALEGNLRFAEDLGAEPIRVRGSDVAKALMQVAHDKNVGSIIIGHSSHGRLHELVRGSIVQKSS
jgi:K+-sensing histidine kinase KdpD